MKILSFAKGDKCWIYLGGVGNPLQESKVLEVLDLSEYGYTYPRYVIEVNTPIDPGLEVRDGFTMSDSPDKPIGAYQNAK